MFKEVLCTVTDGENICYCVQFSKTLQCFNVKLCSKHRAEILPMKWHKSKIHRVWESIGRTVEWKRAGNIQVENKT